MSLMDGQNNQPRDADGQNVAQQPPVQAAAPAPAESPILPAPVTDASSAPVQESPELPAPVAPAEPQASPMPTPPSPQQADEPAPSPYTIPPEDDIAGPEDDGSDKPFAAGEGQRQPEDSAGLSWTASEFIAHHKTNTWYIALAGVTLALMALMYLISREIFPVVIIVICAGLFGYMASRQPRELPYALDSKGITIGRKFYPYTDFNAYGVFHEGAFSSIDFMPLKRFSPILSIQYDPQHEEPIMELLNQHLPLSPHKRTAIDALMARIRF